MPTTHDHDHFIPQDETPGQTDGQETLFDTPGEPTTTNVEASADATVPPITPSGAATGYTGNVPKDKGPVAKPVATERSWVHRHQKALAGGAIVAAVAGGIVGGVEAISGNSPHNAPIAEGTINPTPAANKAPNASSSPETATRPTDAIGLLNSFVSNVLAGDASDTYKDLASAAQAQVSETDWGKDVKILDSFVNDRQKPTLLSNPDTLNDPALTGFTAQYSVSGSAEDKTFAVSAAKQDNQWVITGIPTSKIPGFITFGDKPPVFDSTAPTATPEVDNTNNLTPVLMTGSTLDDIFKQFTQNQLCMTNGTPANQEKCLEYLVGPLNSVNAILYNPYQEYIDQLNTKRAASPSYNIDREFHIIKSGMVNGQAVFVVNESESVTDGPGSSVKYVRYTLAQVPTTNLGNIDLGSNSPASVWLEIGAEPLTVSTLTLQ